MTNSGKKENSGNVNKMLPTLLATVNRQYSLTVCRETKTLKSFINSLQIA